MIIDMHTHFNNYEFLGEGIRLTEEEFINELDCKGIDKAVVSNPFYLETDFIYGNRILFNFMGKYPDRIIGFAIAHPLFPEESLEIIKEGVDKGIKGIKLHCELSHSSYTSVAHLELVEKISEFKLPITLHTGTKYLETAPKLASLFPGTTFLFGHTGGFAYREMSERVKDLGNVIADLCGNVFTNNFVEDIVKTVGADRVVYGSDFDFFNPAIMLAMVKNAKLSDVDKKKILWKNAERILAL